MTLEWRNINAFDIKRIADSFKICYIIFVKCEFCIFEVFKIKKLFKPFNLEELLKAVGDAIEFDRRQFKRISLEVQTKRDYESLTPREREVCSWLVKGLLNKDIALKLGTTDATIKVHKARVMEKMHVDSVQTLVKKYLESNLEDHPLSKWAIASICYQAN